MHFITLAATLLFGSAAIAQNGLSASPITFFSPTDGSLQLRLYGDTVKSTGGRSPTNYYPLAEFEWDGGQTSTWTNNGYNFGTPQDFTGIGSVTWLDPNTDIQNVCMFYCTGGNQLQGWMWTGGPWAPDTNFNNNQFSCTPRTSIAAVQWSSGQEIRLHVQASSDYTIQEFNTRARTDNENIYIAAVTVGSSVPSEIDVFYQTTQNVNGLAVTSLIQMQWASATNWVQTYNFGHDPDISLRGALGALAFTDLNTGLSQIRLYVGHGGNRVEEFISVNGKWILPAQDRVVNIMENVTFPLGVIGWFDNGGAYRIRMYFDNGGYYQEMSCDGCTDSGNTVSWQKSATIYQK